MENINSTKQTFGGAMAEKVVAHIRAHKFGELCKQLVELICGLAVGGIMVAPNVVTGLIQYLVTTNDFALPKFITFFSAFLFRKKIIKLIRRFRRRAEKAAIEEGEALIEGIPVAELADYLIRNTHFRREGNNGVRSTFGLNMQKFNKLAAILEKKRIVTRGENNMRVLDGRWSRQALIDFLSQPDSENWFRVFKINDPSAKIRFDKQEIAARA